MPDNTQLKRLELTPQLGHGVNLSPTPFSLYSEYGMNLVLMYQVETYRCSFHYLVELANMKLKSTWQEDEDGPADRGCQ